MNMKTTKSLAAASLALILLAACGSSGMGDILGGGSPQQSNYEIRGTVESVDNNSRSIFLSNVTGYNASMLSNGGTGTVRVYFDDRTPVEFNGQTYRPTDLERGDQVAVRVDESGNQLLAESMTVLRDVSTGSGSSFPTYPSGSYETSIRGTVRYVDSSRRTIEVDRGNGSTTFVEYDTNTPVRFNNQTYNPVDLERGDEIDIRVSDLGNNRFLAREISVIRSVSGTSSSGGIYGSTSNAIIRGTVARVDTSRRTIELESTNWISNFNTGAGSTSRTVINYPANASIFVNGRSESIAGLERGDVIEVEVSRDGSTLWAQRMSLVRDVNSY